MISSTTAPYLMEINQSVASNEVYNFPTASGIDSCYYFIESNSVYREFFHFSVFSTVEQAKESNGGHIPKDLLRIKISDIEITYLGKEQGFYFFSDLVGTFRIGFKDPDSNKGVHDIRVQLQGIGIYSLGIIRLCDYINKVILKEISTDRYYITRADLNIFCQFDLGSVIVPEHIITRKRKFMRVIGNKNIYETLYIGKPPAMLRIYNKALEIDKDSKKSHYLQRYLEKFGISVNDPFWNFEFECHRDFLKQYNISTLDDLLANAQMLFKKIMEQIRLGDMTTISSKDLEAGRIYKADNHPLWDYLSRSYRFNSVEQITIPLERLCYIPNELTANDFLDDLKVLTNKYAEHSVIVNYEQIREVLHDSHLWLSPKAKKAIKPFVPIELQTNDRTYLFTRNYIAVPIIPNDLSIIDNGELEILEKLLIKALHQELAKNDQDIALIIKHTKAIAKEKESRIRIGKESLWQR